jgi:hypothetical protein
MLGRLLGVSKKLETLRQLLGGSKLSKAIQALQAIPR